MTRSHTIPWLRIGVESVAIVVSILFAFAIDAWWDDRQDRLRERLQIQALAIEFEGNLEFLHDELNRLRRIVSLLDELIQRLNSVDAGTELEIPGTHFFVIRQMLISDPPTGTLDSMISSGEIGLLRDESLKAVLSEWSALLADIRTDQLTARDFTAQQLIPYLGTLGNFTNVVLPEEISGITDDAVMIVNSTEQLRTTMSFKLLIFQVALEKFESLVALSESIVGLLQESQASFDS